MRHRAVILGAGIGGLTAAHHLTALAQERGLDLELMVLEAGERPGGALVTERVEGVLLERGPDTLVTHKPAGLALVERLGLGARVRPQPSGRIDVLHRGELLPLPEGFALIAPLQAQSLAASPLLSDAGKRRALREPEIPARQDSADESVAAFVRRRFGDEVYEALTEPVAGGLYMADCEHLSLAATFPRFAALERERGFLLGAAPAKSPSGGASPATVTLDGGLGQIVAALVERLPHAALRLNVAVNALTRQERGFQLKLDSGESVSADAVVIALPAPAAAKLLRDFDTRLAAEIGATRFASCATVHLAWPRRSLTHTPESLGFFVPRTAGSAVVAGSFVSTKYPERVPEDLFVVRAFLGGALHEQTLERSNSDLAALATNMLSPLLGATAPPTWSHLWRQPGSMPQRRVGHLEQVKKIEALVAAHPGLALAGGPVGAYGLPDSIAAGVAAAGRVAQDLLI